MAKKFKTKITEMLDIEHPILCGGMQWLSRAEFVAEVCNAGALGFITAETFPTAEDLREELRKMKTLTDRPFGVNISMIPEMGNIPERTMKFVDVVCDEGVSVVETAGRSPAPLVPRLKEGGVKIIHKMTSVRHAVSAQKAGVDAVALLGFGSGGHIGLENVASFISLPLAVRQLDIPVVAAGAVADGRGFLGALAMGAEGVLMGTRFLATDECPLGDEIKRVYVETPETNTTLIMSSILNPLRCVKNALTDDVQALEARGASLEQIIDAVRGGRKSTGYEGVEPKKALLPCGQSIGLIEGIKPVKQVIEDILAEAEALLGRLNAMAV
ncbi:MAG: nitronate monooxygenase [Deltaproteobacteria bacterium]|nr:nitronate monooxygenase [Deltaproteobacteria bacterium]